MQTYSRKSNLQTSEVSDTSEVFVNTCIQLDENAEYEIRAADLHSRCGWTPFEGCKVKGRVTRVVLRGRDAFKDGKVLAEKGFGKNVRNI